MMCFDRCNKHRSAAASVDLRIVFKHHSRTSQEPPDSGKPVIFGQKPAAKNNKKIGVRNLLNEKTEFMLSSEIKCPKSGTFTANYWVG